MGDHAQTTDLGPGSARSGLGGHGRPWETMGDHGRPWETMPKLRIWDPEVHTLA